MTREEIKELLETNTWWRELSDELDRVYRINQTKDIVPDDVKVEAVNALREHTYITEEKLRHVNIESVFVEARTILARLVPDESYPERLTELYKAQKPDALDRINQTALTLVSLIHNGTVREKVERLWISDRSTLKLVDLNSPSTDLHVRGQMQRYIIRSLSELSCMDEIVRDYTDCPFPGRIYIPMNVKKAATTNKEVAAVPGADRLNYLAYRVYDPLWDQWMERFEPEYVNFPLKWAGAIFSVKQMMFLFEQYKAGGDLSSQILSLYQNTHRLARLQNAIASCPLTSPYKEVFDEIIDNFQNSRFKVCSMSLLPIVEGILWEFAWSCNRINGGIFDRAINRLQYKRLEFELLKPDGERIHGRPNIGALLRKTKFEESFM